MRTPLTLSILEQQLQQSCGDMYSSCREAGVSVQFVTQWMKDDEEVNTKITEAQRVGYMGLESAAIQRAVHGYEKKIFYKGIHVDDDTVYSDGLLVKLLEANTPKFAKSSDQNVYNGPVQINNMPRAETFEEWLTMKELTMQRRLEETKPVLEAPKQEINVIDMKPKNVFEELGI